MSIVVAATMCTGVKLLSIVILLVGESVCREKITCGKLKYPFGSIVKGTDNIIPWAVFLVNNKEGLPKEKAIMPGILVSPSLVFLSASNFYNDTLQSLQISRFNSQYTVVIGSLEFSNDTVQGQRIPVTLISVHPKFKISKMWKGFKHDFALAHLKSPVKLSEKVQPVCIPSFEDKSPMENISDFNPLFMFEWSKNYTSHYRVIPLKTLNRTRCKDSEKRKERNNSYCAVASQTNDAGYCPKRGIGYFYWSNGSYFLGGRVKNSNQENGTCAEKTPFFMKSLSNETLEWIKNTEKCGPKEYTCFSGGRCIEISKLCDGKIDCKDNSDEIAEFCQNPSPCNFNEFKCKVYGSCVSNSSVNDGKLDCPDGEDEKEANIKFKSEKDAPTKYELPQKWRLVIGVSMTGVIIIGYVYFHLKVKRLKRHLRDLTKAEVNEFFDGSDYTTHNDYLEIADKRESRNYSPLYINSSALAQPWNDIFEISEKQLDIGEELGRGQFGVVYKGNLKIQDTSDLSTTTQDVAVKTQLSGMGVEEFKNLLREVKITAHVGSHDCVVSIVGACTQNIKKRKVYLVVEYCSNGNLLKFLNDVDNNDLKKIYDFEDPNFFCTITKNFEPGIRVAYADLLKWAQQIASGMAHLGRKNVIHGDLAARNVLLSDNLDAKICDFGLSRELTDKNIYVKTSNQPIPWKWLAPESFTSHTFSYATDVWAYGVTLWEIFSLGESPYGNIPCNASFVLNLQKGGRLPKPDFASTQLYEILLNTWNDEPQKRPDFAYLELLFHNFRQCYLQPSEI